MTTPREDGRRGVRLGESEGLLTTTAVPAAGFNVVTETRGEEAWLIAAGELDIGSGALLDDAIRSSVAGAPLVIDLREVSFCDSTGLAILLRAHRRIGQLTILAGPALRRVADIAGVSSLLLDA